MLRSHSPPPPPGGGTGVYGAVSNVGEPLLGDAGHQGDEKIIAPPVRARWDKVQQTPVGINRPPGQILSST